MTRVDTEAWQTTMSRPLASLQETLGYRFRQEELLLEALSHSSFIAEYESSVPDNQRLEFLGDAVIQIVITERLYLHFPDKDEGALTQLRAVLTRQETLVELARRLDLGEYLRLGRGEESTAGAERPSNLCDAFEALIGAVYLDSPNSLAEVRRLVNRLVDQACPDFHAQLEEHNPKGSLQEYAQREVQLRPVYKVVTTTGPDHQREFTVEVRIGDKVYGTGTGAKRQAAEAAAASAALALIREQTPLADPPARSPG